MDLSQEGWLQLPLRPTSIQNVEIGIQPFEDTGFIMPEDCGKEFPVIQLFTSAG